MSRIVLTFKNNEKEKQIEAFLDTKVSATGYIKELVWEVINNTTTTSHVVKNEYHEEIQQASEQPKKKKVGKLVKK